MLAGEIAGERAFSRFILKGKLHAGRRTEHANAKVNLFLEVTGKREDGFHDVVTVMQTVSLSDGITVDVRPLPSGAQSVITLHVSNKSVPADSHNSAYQAASEFLAAARSSAEVDITIRKSIPTASGLGGGSADAASVLRCLNSLAGGAVPMRTMREIARKIGADVPFCLTGGCCLCEGIGEILTPLPTLQGYHIVVAIGSERSSTVAAYRMLDDGFYRGNRTAEGLLAYLRSQEEREEPPALDELLYNAFENIPAARTPAMLELRARLRELGGEAVLLSGSGTALYALFREEERAQSAVNDLRAEGVHAWLTRPMPPY